MIKIIFTVLLTMIIAACFSQQPGNNPQQNNAVINNQPDQPAYRNMKTFTQNGVFQLPKGTTQVMIEAWGAGGGGSNTGGGGGGAYGKTVFAVIDGGSITVTIGLGGKGGTYQATSGGNTYAQFRGAMQGATGVSLSVDGGKGAGYIVGAGGAADQGEGGAAANINSGPSGFYSASGEDGETYIDDYQQSGQNSFVVTRYIGKGGNAGNTIYTGGRGDVVLNPASPGYKRYGTKGKSPGGGGGGSILPIGGYKGADGMVIIYF